MFVNSPSRMTERDCGDAVRMMFSSREEIAELFEGMEVQLVERMQQMCEDAKKARHQEWPLPPEDERPTADDPAPPVVKMK
jgi:hypothetical protein